MLRKILIALDGSKRAESALPYAEQFARANRARVVVVRVVPPSPGRSTEEAPPRDPSSSDNDGDEPGETLEELRAVRAAARYLHAVAGFLGRRGLVAESVVSIGDPATMLVGEARLHHVDMIIMSTRGRSRVDRWIRGSVADRVMEEADVPVLLVPRGCRSEVS